MLSTDTFKFECIRCGHCCTDRNTIVNLSYIDILRIKRGLGLTLEELLEIVGFYIYTDQLNEKTRSKLVMPPLETERGLSFIGLMKNSIGTCLFYDIKNKKCLIYSIRPDFCRTFPFTFKTNPIKSQNQDASIKILLTEKGKEYCLGLTDSAPFINNTEWRHLGKKVLENLRKNANLINQWNTLIKKEKIIPSVKNFLLKIIG